MKDIFKFCLIVIWILFIQCTITPDVEEEVQLLARIAPDNIPLNDTVTFTYQGYTSGLYPWGNLLIQNQYQSDYFKTCKLIKPLDTSGNMTRTGKVVILGLGGSNPQHIYNAMKTLQAGESFGRNLILVNSAIGGKDLPDIIDPTVGYWNTVNKQLDSLGLTAAQVQVIFCIQEDFSNSDTTILRAFQMRDSYLTLLDVVRDKFPNCKLFLAGDRGYNDYATLSKYWEPKGYLNGWGIKMMVEDYINGLLPQYPLINWLDYYWANGNNLRNDGLFYAETDFLAPVYAHLTDEKCTELATRTHNKLKLDIGTRLWYR